MAYTPPENLPQLYKAIFEDDRRGALVLEDLYQRFAAHAKVHTDGGIDAVLKTYRDASMRKPIEFITVMINRANGVDDEQPPETSP